MYVQASEHFPGILLDMEKRTLRFSIDKFISEFEEAMAHFDQLEYFDTSNAFSVVYNRFLELDLSDIWSNGEPRGRRFLFGNGIRPRVYNGNFVCNIFHSAVIRKNDTSRGNNKYENRRTGPGYDLKNT